MFISTKGRYALRVMLDLAQQDPTEYISIKSIAQRQNISAKYLESIITILNKAGFVHSLRGKGGGHRLAKQPDKYTVASILKLTEGSLSPVSCLESEPNTCPKANDCITLPMWKKLYNMIDDYFEGITLQDLIDQHNISAADDYSI